MGDGAGGDKIVPAFLLEDRRIGSRPKSPKLEENVGPIGMDGVCHL